MWVIGLKSDIKTLNEITHQCIMYTGFLAKWFKTDKAQLRYKQLYHQYSTLYVDYPKLLIKLVRQFIGGTLYTSKLGFKKFFPLSNETLSENGNTLRGFIELVGLPSTMNPYNHKNFKEGVFM